MTAAATALPRRRGSRPPAAVDRTAAAAAARPRRDAIPRWVLAVFVVVPSVVALLRGGGARTASTTAEAFVPTRTTTSPAATTARRLLPHQHHRQETKKRRTTEDDAAGSFGTVRYSQSRPDDDVDDASFDDETTARASEADAEETKLLRLLQEFSNPRTLRDPSSDTKKLFFNAKDLSRGELAKAVFSLRPATYRKGDILFRKGDVVSKPDDPILFVLESGAVELYPDRPAGAAGAGGERGGGGDAPSLLLRYERFGDVFGESVLFSSLEHLFTAEAASDAVRAWTLSKRDYENSAFSQDRAFSRQLQSSVVDDERSVYRDIFETKSKIDALKRCVLFQGSSEDDLNRVAKAMEIVEYQPGETVVKEGDTVVESMYLVRSGAFECYKEFQPANVLMECTSTKDNYFGELGILLDQPRAASVRAASAAATLWRLNKDDFFTAVQDSPIFASALDTIKARYKTENVWEAVSKLAPGQIYELAVLSSRPKKESVSFHSLVSTVMSSLLFYILLECFDPGFNEQGYPRIFDFQRYVEPSFFTQWTLLLFAISATGGVLRLPKNATRLRKLMFTQGGIFTVLLCMLGDSNIGLYDSNNYVFDLLSAPGRALFFAILVPFLWISGELISEGIGGPERGRNTTPLWGNRVMLGLLESAGVVPIYLTLQIFFPVFTGDTAAYRDIYVPNFEVAHRVLETSNIVVAGIIGYVILYATLLFESKISQRTCAILMPLSVFLLGVWDNTIQIANPTPEFAAVREYTTQAIHDYHVNEFTLAYLAFFIGRGIYKYYQLQVEEQQKQQLKAAKMASKNAK